MREARRFDVPWLLSALRECITIPRTFGYRTRSIGVSPLWSHGLWVTGCPACCTGRASGVTQLRKVGSPQVQADAAPDQRSKGVVRPVTPGDTDSLRTGLYAMATAGHREPCDPRGSCTVLGAPSGNSSGAPVMSPSHQGRSGSGSGRSWLMRRTSVAHSPDSCRAGRWPATIQRLM
jgi:hypothetical protein